MKQRLLFCVLAAAPGSPCVAATRGGIAPDAVLLRVTTLADSGPGSLRQAVAQTGPRIVVFDVGGTIRLKADLKIEQPMVTISGQSEPAPGITLAGASLRVRAAVEYRECE